jgi:hypothetical protein
MALLRLAAFVFALIVLAPAAGIAQTPTSPAPASTATDQLLKPGELDALIVNHAGTVFQKDLGPNTTRVAERMTSFNPDKTWQAVTDTEPLR